MKQKAPWNMLHFSSAWLWYVSHPCHLHSNNWCLLSIKRFPTTGLSLFKSTLHRIKELFWNRNLIKSLPTWIYGSWILIIYEVQTPDSHCSHVPIFPSSSLFSPQILGSRHPAQLAHCSPSCHVFSLLPAFADAVSSAWHTIPSVPCLANPCLSYSKSPLQNLLSTSSWWHPLLCPYS